MAVKNKELDPIIIKEAKEEFIRHGFQKASLHTIAKNAGITTGALYTRYKNKDDLFCSLVRDVLEDMKTKSYHCASLYEKVMEERSSEAFLNAIKAEEKVYLDILFEHYDECLLLFCCSDGSSIGDMINVMMKQKSQQTISFFQSIAKNDIDMDGITLIMSEQFFYYRKILEYGYDKDKAISCMKTVELFLEAGWKKLFEEMLDSK